MKGTLNLLFKQKYNSVFNLKTGLNGIKQFEFFFFFLATGIKQFDKCIKIRDYNNGSAGGWG